jgi:HEAT repeat protein
MLGAALAAACALCGAVSVLGAPPPIAGAGAAVLAQASATEEADQVADEPDTTGLADLSPAELFVRATAAELQFAELVAPSRRLLVRNYATSIPYLVKRLDTDGARERYGLENIMVDIGEPAVLPLIDAVLEEAQRTDTTRGARLAASILGKLGDARAVDALVEIRGHDDWKVRSSVAGSLGRIAQAASLSALLDMLADENEIVRKSAAVAARRTVEACGDEPLPDGTVAALVAALDDTHYSVRYGASEALASIGEPAVQHLLDVALQAEGSRQHLAIRALGEMRSARALGPLRGLLETEDWATRAYASEAIGRIGADRRTRKDLARMLREERHPFVLLKAAEALAPAGS